MRVIAGKFRSRVLRSLRGADLRPTSDRLRETLFNILGPAVEDAVFVDAYAGTGAVGIEALSRGARHAVFVEKHARAVAIIQANLKALGIHNRAEVMAMDVIRAFSLLDRKGAAADFIFADPPYDDDDAYERVLQATAELSVLAPTGWLIVEHEKRRSLPIELASLVRTRVVVQGDAALSFYWRRI